VDIFSLFAGRTKPPGKAVPTRTIAVGATLQTGGFGLRDASLNNEAAQRDTALARADLTKKTMSMFVMKSFAGFKRIITDPTQKDSYHSSMSSHSRKPTAFLITGHDVDRLALRLWSEAPRVSPLYFSLFSFMPPLLFAVFLTPVASKRKTNRWPTQQPPKIVAATVFSGLNRDSTLLRLQYPPSLSRLSTAPTPVNPVQSTLNPHNLGAHTPLPKLSPLKC